MVSDAACALPLGSCCCKIPITVHYTFFLLLGLQVLNGIRQEYSKWQILLLAVLYGPVLLITIIVHELGHAWMNKQFGRLGAWEMCGCFGWVPIALC